MSNWGCSKKVCASCRYWGGKRNIDFIAGFFQVLEERGTCSGIKASFRGFETYVNSSCDQWEAVVKGF